jgi:hypothetical protein
MEQDTTTAGEIPSAAAAKTIESETELLEKVRQHQLRNKDIEEKLEIAENKANNAMGEVKRVEKEEEQTLRKITTATTRNQEADMKHDEAMTTE